MKSMPANLIKRTHNDADEVELYKLENKLQDRGYYNNGKSDQSSKIRTGARLRYPELLPARSVTILPPIIFSRTTTTRNQECPMNAFNPL